MKKIHVDMRKLGIILAFLVLMCACGCAVTGGDDVSTTPTAATTTPSKAERTIPLNIPDEIVIEGCYSDALDLTIRPSGEYDLSFYSQQEGEKVVALCDEDIKQINSLYASITDFSNLPEMDEATPDVTLTDDGQTYRFCAILTTQVELEQFLGLLYSYYSGEEYDWETSVALHMPARIELAIDTYDGFTEMTIEKIGDRQLRFTTPEDVRECTLNNEAIMQLNTAYEKITDFSDSGEYVFEDEPDVTILIDGETYGYHYGMAKQPELDLYIDMIKAYVHQAAPVS